MTTITTNQSLLPVAFQKKKKKKKKKRGRAVLERRPGGSERETLLWCAGGSFADNELTTVSEKKSQYKDTMKSY